MTRREQAEQLAHASHDMTYKALANAIEAALKDRDERAARIAETCEYDQGDGDAAAYEGFTDACLTIATAILDEERD